MSEFSRPELVVGADGRWHLLYVDLATGSIMSWNSL
jgi:hypothetical protein